MTGKKKKDRRSFLKKSSIITLGISLSNSPGLFASVNETLKCKDIHDHFKEIGTWVNWEQTTDSFKAGDSMKPVKRIAVVWKASVDAIQKAISMNVDLIIAHESICVNADNSSKLPEIEFALPTELPKFELIKQAGLVIYRCHDFWDGFPEAGIRSSWQRGLNIGDKIVADQYHYYVTEITPMTVRELSNHILTQIKPLRQNGVLVSGDLDKVVTKVGTGTGVTTDAIKLRELGADVGIVTDDYYKHVRMGVHANELDFPTITVNHGVAEEWGIINLVKYIQCVFPKTDVSHIPQYCPYEIIY